MPESNRRLRASARCSIQLELTPSRNTVSHASAYAAAAPRAPDGAQTRTAVACSIDAPHCRLSPTGNPFGRDAPLWVFSPRAARVGASRRSAHAPVAAAPLPRGAHARYPDAPGRKGTSVVERSEPRCMRILRERWKQNAPGTCDPRAFAFLGRSGWPISQGVSRMSEVQVPCAFGTAQVAAVRTQRQAAARGLQGGLAVEGIGGLHGKNSVAEKTATWPTGAHDTPLVCDAQHFFLFIFEARPTVVESVASGCR